MNTQFLEDETPSYVIVPNSLLESGNGDAVLIYGFLANFPDGYHPMRWDMMNVVGGSRTRYAKGSRLLREQGYLTKVAVPLQGRGNAWEFRFNPFPPAAFAEVQP